MPGRTICVATGDVLFATLPSPAYTAVMLCEPTLSVLVVKVAMPFALSEPVPSVVVPSLNVTVPVGLTLLPPRFTVTVAVNVTVCWNVDGLGAAVNVVVEPSLFTTCTNTGEVLPPTVPSPLYSAVMLCDPTLKLEVMNVATPFASSVPVPSVVAPSLNVMLPVGTAVRLVGLVVPLVASVTVAVKVTLSLNTDGFGDDCNATWEFAKFTKCGCGISDVLALKFESPSYAAVSK